MLLAKSTFPATMGEWVQGWIGGRESLVSLVVDWRGCVELHENASFAASPGAAGEKARKAFEKAKTLYPGKGLEDCCVCVKNPLPVARGFATSTMDIAGVFASCAAYAGEELSEERLFSLCTGQEASDGIMFEGLALVDHLGGYLIERLPLPPPVEMLVILPDRTLDTSDYRENAARMRAVKTLAREYERAYDILKRGLSEGDPELIAEASSLSASLQQIVMPRDEWDLLVESRRLFGALGIAVAHSGTASALLFEGGNSSGMYAAREWFADRFFGHNADIKMTKAAGGGFLVEKLCS